MGKLKSMGSEALHNSSNTATTSTDMTAGQEQHKYKLSYSVGVAENTNIKYRPTMEDVHTYVENFAERLDWGYFAIFDGHAGKQAAKWCGQYLHSIVERKLVACEDEDDVRNILNESFLEADAEMLKNVKGASGCTAAVALLRWELPDQPQTPSTTTTTQTQTQTHIQTPVQRPHSNSNDDDITLDGSEQSSELDHNKYKRMLYTANVGDTRIVLCRSSKAVRLTYDHKASDANEARRIERAGGVVMKARVNGMLAVTRSLGDQFFKELVIGSPYTTAVELDLNVDKFLIIACDGLWDVVTDQQACDLIKGFTDSKLAAKALVDHALDKLTTDNITVMVVFFK